MDIKILHQLFLQNPIIDTDTRKIRIGSLFFALKGENFNGNKFAEQALKKGAKYAIIDDIAFQKNDYFILVKNVLETLQKLANFHRNYLNIPIISLTGSNGKTTTKELINTVLSTKFKTTATIGNLNNHIGVPLTLLSMNSQTEIGIVEMGANHLNEIAMLCKIAAPTYGCITNFGKAHLEGFGSVEGVVKAKSELYDFLRNSKGKAFVNSDDKKQVKQSKGIDTILFNSAQIEFLEANPFVKIRFKNTEIKSQLIGKYNYNNIATAIAIGNFFNISKGEIKNALENYIPTNNRSQIINTKSSNKIILDAYNANPSSMQVAIENFKQLKDSSKIVFLGDMFELGTASNAEHQKIAELATSSNFKEVYLIGKAFSTTSVKNAFIFDTFENFKNATNFIKFQNSSILIKGSRGMALERILDFF